MAKYNIQPKKEKIARYQSMLSEETKDRLRDEIIRVLVTERSTRTQTIVPRNLQRI